MIWRGDGPPILFCPRRDALVAGLGEAVRLLPGRGVPRRRVRRPRPRRVHRGRHGPFGRQPRRRRAHACSRRLDLHGAVLVGHSMGGMAVQAFAIRHPDVAHRTRVRARADVDRRARAHQRRAPRSAVRLERLVGVGARRRRVHAPAEPRVAARADGLRRRPAPEPRRSHPSDARRVLARDAARARRAPAVARPHARACPTITLPDPRARRHCRRAHAAARPRRDRRARSPTRASWSSRAPGTCSCTSALPRSTSSILDFARDRAREAAMRSGRATAQ